MTCGSTGTSMGRRRKKKEKARSHPWTLWLNGDEHELVEGVDFTCTYGSFRSIVSRMAKRQGVRITLRKVPGSDPLRVRLRCLTNMAEKSKLVLKLPREEFYRLTGRSGGLTPGSGEE